MDSIVYESFANKRIKLNPDDNLYKEVAKHNPDSEIIIITNKDNNIIANQNTKAGNKNWNIVIKTTDQIDQKFDQLFKILAAQNLKITEQNLNINSMMKHIHHLSKREIPIVIADTLKYLVNAKNKKFEKSTYYNSSLNEKLKNFLNDKDITCINILKQLGKDSEVKIFIKNANSIIDKHNNKSAHFPYEVIEENIENVNEFFISFPYLQKKYKFEYFIACNFYLLEKYFI